MILTLQWVSKSQAVFQCLVVMAMAQWQHDLCNLVASFLQDTCTWFCQCRWVGVIVFEAKVYPLGLATIFVPAGIWCNWWMCMPSWLMQPRRQLGWMHPTKKWLGWERPCVALSMANLPLEKGEVARVVAEDTGARSEAVGITQHDSCSWKRINLCTSRLTVWGAVRGVFPGDLI